jgi:hypothetical protein
MITRDQLLSNLKVGMKVRVDKNKFHWTDEGILTLDKIEGFTLFWKKEDGAEIIEGLAKGYGYDFDGKYILTYHNDRTEGWVVVDKKEILQGRGKE